MKDKPEKLPDGNPEGVTTNTNDLVERVADILMRGNTMAEYGTPAWCKIKAQFIIDEAMPFDEIRKLAEKIGTIIFDDDSYALKLDLINEQKDKIIALLPDPPKPEMSMRDEVRCVLLDCLKEFKGYQCISNFNITNYMDSIMAIVKGGGEDE